MGISYSIDTPVDRENALRAIGPEHAKANHGLLQQIFAAEIAYRREDEEWDYFENIYWCAWLLFHVGDPNDVEKMWEAKYLNMDTGVGFDIENMVGAGVVETVAHLRSQQLDEIADNIEQSFSGDSGSRLETWLVWRRRHFDAL